MRSFIRLVYTQNSEISGACEMSSVSTARCNAVDEVIESNARLGIDEMNAPSSRASAAVLPSTQERVMR